MYSLSPLFALLFGAILWGLVEKFYLSNSSLPQWGERQCKSADFAGTPFAKGWGKGWGHFRQKLSNRLFLATLCFFSPVMFMDAVIFEVNTFKKGPPLDAGGQHGPPPKLRPNSTTFTNLTCSTANRAHSINSVPLALSNGELSSMGVTFQSCECECLSSLECDRFVYEPGVGDVDDGDISSRSGYCQLRRPLAGLSLWEAMKSLHDPLKDDFRNTSSACVWVHNDAVATQISPTGPDDDLEAGSGDTMIDANEVPTAVCEKPGDAGQWTCPGTDTMINCEYVCNDYEPADCADGADEDADFCAVWNVGDVTDADKGSGEVVLESNTSLWQYVGQYVPPDLRHKLQGLLFAPHPDDVSHATRGMSSAETEPQCNSLLLRDIPEQTPNDLFQRTVCDALASSQVEWDTQCYGRAPIEKRKPRKYFPKEGKYSEGNRGTLVHFNRTAFKAHKDEVKDLNDLTKELFYRAWGRPSVLLDCLNSTHRDLIRDTLEVIDCWQRRPFDIAEWVTHLTIGVVVANFFGRAFDVLDTLPFLKIGRPLMEWSSTTRMVIRYLLNGIFLGIVVWRCYIQGSYGIRSISNVWERQSIMEARADLLYFVYSVCLMISGFTLVSYVTGPGNGKREKRFEILVKLFENYASCTGQEKGKGKSPGDYRLLDHRSDRYWYFPCIPNRNVEVVGQWTPESTIKLINHVIQYPDDRYFTVETAKDLVNLSGVELWHKFHDILKKEERKYGDKDPEMKDSKGKTLKKPPSNIEWTEIKLKECKEKFLDPAKKKELKEEKQKIQYNRVRRTVNWQILRFVAAIRNIPPQFRSQSKRGEPGNWKTTKEHHGGLSFDAMWAATWDVIENTKPRTKIGTPSTNNYNCFQKICYWLNDMLTNNKFFEACQDCMSWLARCKGTRKFYVADFGWWEVKGFSDKQKDKDWMKTRFGKSTFQTVQDADGNHEEINDDTFGFENESERASAIVGVNVAKLDKDNDGKINETEFQDLPYLMSAEGSEGSDLEL